MKEEQKNWQIANREMNCYISNMYSPIFADTDLPSEQVSWQLSSKTPCHHCLFIPFLIRVLQEEGGREMGRLVQVSVMCWILMRWQLCPVTGAFLKCCLQTLQTPCIFLLIRELELWKIKEHLCLHLHACWARQHLFYWSFETFKPYKTIL